MTDDTTRDLDDAIFAAERCPTCGSDSRATWITGTPQNPDRERCADLWHYPRHLLRGVVTGGTKDATGRRAYIVLEHEDALELAIDLIAGVESSRRRAYNAKRIAAAAGVEPALIPEPYGSLIRQRETVELLDTVAEALDRYAARRRLEPLGGDLTVTDAKAAS